MVDRQLLRRAWDALDSFKQAYPENWHDEDEQVLKDLMRADLNPPKREWQGLTDDDLRQIILVAVGVAEAKLKQKNT